MSFPLVRAGEDFAHPPDRETRAPNHLFPIVYSEVLLQIARDYPGAPDVRTLSAADLRFFYEGLREDLIRATRAPQKNG